MPVYCREVSGLSSARLSQTGTASRDVLVAAPGTDGTVRGTGRDIFRALVEFASCEAPSSGGGSVSLFRPAVLRFSVI